MFRGRISQVALAAVTVAGTSWGASAAPVDYSFNACPASYTADGTARVYYGAAPPQLSAASSCTYLLPATNANDQVGGVTDENHANVNDVTGVAATIDGFFGITTWQTTGLDHADQSASSGTWAIPAADLDFAAFNYMLVFKDGNDTNLVAFLLNEEASSGSWLTPFTDPPFDFPGGSTSHETSHISLYKTVVPPTPRIVTPEPISAALFGLGLVGLGLFRRK